MYVGSETVLQPSVSVPLLTWFWQSESEYVV
jgi:hypothetical protein